MEKGANASKEHGGVTAKQKEVVTAEGGKPLKRMTARDIEYTDEEVRAVSENLDEMLSTLPVVHRGETPGRRTAKVVIRELWPKIKSLIGKGYTKKFIRDDLAKRGAMDVPLATFQNACKALEKEDAAKLGGEHGGRLNAAEGAGLDESRNGMVLTEKELVEHPVAKI